MSTVTLTGMTRTVLGLEVRRVLRNRRTVVFSVVMPVVFFVLLNTDRVLGAERVGSGNRVASVMISMALYGAVLASTGCGAPVCLDRAGGWTRTLAITPLGSARYLTIRALAASALSLIPIVAVYLCGLVGESASMPTYAWLTSAVILWFAAMLFAAFGLAVGFTLPSENVTQILTFLVMVFAFAGGLFFPIDDMGPTVLAIARWTPLYGLNALVHAPLLGRLPSWTELVDVLAWLGAFAALATWRARRTR